MLQDLKEKINQASQKLPALYIGIGSVAAYRCLAKSQFGNTDQEDVWDLMEELFNASMKSGVQEDDIDDVFQALVKLQFKTAEKRLHNILVRANKEPELLPDLPKPQSDENVREFIIPTPPDSDESDQEEEPPPRVQARFKPRKSQENQDFGLDDDEIERQKRYLTQQEQNELKNQELIQRMMEQDEKEAQERRKKLLQEGQSLCKICYMAIQEEIFPLENCQHLFHQECLGEYLKNEINQGKFPIKCAEAECGKEITIGDIRDILDQEMVEKFYKFSFNTYVTEHPKEVSCCPTADCNFHFYWNQEDGKEFDCPECKSKYCLDCKADWHQGQTCEEYKVTNSKDQNDLKFDKFVTGQNFKKCPHCGFWVERLYGCEFIVCKCGKNFCYLCGKHHPNAHFCPDKSKYKNIRPALIQRARPRKTLARKKVAPKKAAPKKPAAKKTAPKRATRATVRKKK